MAIPGNPLPFGLRDLKIRALDATGETPSAGVDLPVGRTFTFAEGESFEDLRGDDSVVASHGSGPVVSWSLESGGLPLDVYKLIAGGAVVSTGVTPSVVKTYTKLGTDARPYFQVEGQAINDNGGDVHGLVHKCKADGDIGGEFADGAFFLTSASGRGFPRTTDSKLYSFIQNETAAVIAP
jgi:hypothetical protein